MSENSRAVTEELPAPTKGPDKEMVKAVLQASEKGTISDETAKMLHNNVSPMELDREEQLG
jgi:hypothetical protein